MTDSPSQRNPIELELTRSIGESATGASLITESKIREMVELFYSRTQQDELLGPVFEERVADWPNHYQTMTRFWSSAVMHAGTYSGRPIEALKFGGLTEAHFRRWVTLFTSTANEVFQDSDAAVFVELAKRMASSIAMRIGVGRLAF
tara:strand:- start:73568 stop:74008 length:441 start_codon:yes stop_codon:yes gene_type:complete